MEVMKVATDAILKVKDAELKAKEIIEEIFRIALISAFVYFFQYITAVLVYIMGLFLFFFY